MAATTTQSTPLLANQLQAAYPEYTFTASERFSWNPVSKTVSYQADGDPARLLHELGHALLGHHVYRRDVELVKMESDAWQKASEIAAEYATNVSEASIEEHMDTYRDWLHARSTCPSCEANGIQSDVDHYRCLECETTWRVNEARTCGLKRYIDQ